MSICTGLTCRRRDWAWVKYRPDSGDFAVLDVAPIDRGQWFGIGGVKFIPGDHVRSINPHLLDDNVDDEFGHPFDAFDALLGISGGPHWSNEGDVVGQQRSKRREIVRFP